nr:Rpn family recombination-promoting nuclease/putative transposase [uncultured Treponema sp.]
MSDTQTLTLTNDYLFKLLLGSEENKACLQDFLECVLDMSEGMITDLELLDKELTKDAVTDKTGILDVKIRLNDGTTIDIEIQNSWSAEFIPRTLFYWSKMYVEGFEEGAPYTSLDKCITINLISQGFNRSSEMHSTYRLLEQKTYKPLTDLMEIHFLSLSAARRFEIQKDPIEKRQKLINWLRFIATDDKEERAMLATTSPILQMLNEKVDVLSLTPEERKLYESRMKLKSDIATISEVQFKSGLAEGEARGSHYKALETAKTMRTMGYPLGDICKIAGLSQAEVEALG